MVHQFAHDSAEVLFVTLQPLNFMTSALRKSITLVRERVTIQLSPPLERKFDINSPPIVNYYIKAQLHFAYNLNNRR
ncbi:MAG: hypothetical protein ACTS6P_01195 [Candidatus Hodgkinia cicadicola]